MRTSGAFSVTFMKSSQYGITSFSAAFMTGIVEWNSGWLFDHYGSEPAWIFSVAMTMIAVIASFVLVFADKKEYGQLYK